MRWLELRIPPLAVLLAFGTVAAMLDQALPAWRVMPAGLPIVSLLLALAAVLIVLPAVLAFRRQGTTVNPTRPESTSRIVDRGIYRISRNPMYLAFAMLLLAWALWLGHPIALALVPAFVMYMNRFQIEPEERALRSRFGAEYSSYLKTVRRWI